MYLLQSIDSNDMNLQQVVSTSDLRLSYAGHESLDLRHDDNLPSGVPVWNAGSSIGRVPSLRISECVNQFAGG